MPTPPDLPAHAATQPEAGANAPAARTKLPPWVYAALGGACVLTLISSIIIVRALVGSGRKAQPPNRAPEVVESPAEPPAIQPADPPKPAKPQPETLDAGAPKPPVVEVADVRPSLTSAEIVAR